MPTPNYLLLVGFLSVGDRDRTLELRAEIQVFAQNDA